MLSLFIISILVFYVLYAAAFLFSLCIDFFDPWYEMTFKDKLLFIFMMLISSVIFPILLGFYVAEKWNEE